MPVYGNFVKRLNKEDIKAKVIDIHKSESENYIYQYKDMKRNDLFNVLKSQCDGEILVDENNRKLIGCVFVGKQKDKGFISNLHVQPKYRRMGFGSILLKDAINKYNGFDLTVLKTNTPAVELYKKSGFVFLDYEGQETNRYYWMKLKSKLNKNDVVLKV